MDIEEINNNRDKFLSNVSSNVEAELKKVGLKLINVNLTDIRDESGYIEALGKEAAAKAINDAKKIVAEKNRDGSIGEAVAMQDQRIQVSHADALAVEGENLAKIKIANSDALKRQREAEAEKMAIASEKVQAAKALEEAYAAERDAENARAEKEKSTQFADVVIPAQINKEKIEINAEAQAEQIRRLAKGEADGIFLKMEAEAKGNFEILTKQAQGFEKLVASAGDNPRDAVLLLIADKLTELVQLQATAISNIKIDKVTVWDGGNNAEGKNATSGFLSGMYKSVPPLQEIFNMAGMQLPEYLKGKDLEEASEIINEKTGNKSNKKPKVDKADGDITPK